MTLSDITIRTQVRPGDLGYISYMHAKIYHEEHQFNLDFDYHMAKSFVEFYELKNFEKHRFWIAEYQGEILGSLVLMDRGAEAQVRFYLLSPKARGLGLGKKLMQLFMDYLYQSSYLSCYLWTIKRLSPAISIYLKNGFKLEEEKSSFMYGHELLEQKYVVDLVQR